MVSPSTKPQGGSTGFEESSCNTPCSSRFSTTLALCRPCEEKLIHFLTRQIREVLQFLPRNGVFWTLFELPLVRLKRFGPHKPRSSPSIFCKIPKLPGYMRVISLSFDWANKHRVRGPTARRRRDKPAFLSRKSDRKKRHGHENLSTQASVASIYIPAAAFQGMRQHLNRTPVDPPSDLRRSCLCGAITI